MADGGLVLTWTQVKVEQNDRFVAVNKKHEVKVTVENLNNLEEATLIRIKIVASQSQSIWKWKDTEVCGDRISDASALHPTSLLFMESLVGTSVFICAL